MLRCESGLRARNAHPKKQLACLGVGNTSSIFFLYSHPWGFLVYVGIVGNVINLAWREPCPHRGGGKELYVLPSLSSVPVQSAASTESTVRTRGRAGLGVWGQVFFLTLSFLRMDVWQNFWWLCINICGFRGRNAFCEGIFNISKSFVHSRKSLQIFFFFGQMCVYNI